MKVHSIVFYTKNLDQAERFYIDIIGLNLEYKTENFISFLFPDGIRLGIKLAKEEREIPGSQTVFIEVENVEEKFNYFKLKNCNFSKELTKEKWATEFAILDPDGNKLTFRE